MDNFDLKKVVGYFLDGKLQKWLEARYYEEELEKTNQLSESDKELSLKLCNIFGVEYNADDIIDAKDVKEENRRLLKLKQYTDDEEIIANIDSVAFNQEELAELYDKGIEKIYLCEGEFIIPKNKKDLDYLEIGNPKVKYPIIKPEEYITQELADILILNSYFAELDDYIVWYNCKFSPFFEINEAKNKIFAALYNEKTIKNSNGSFMAWNKKTNECFAFEIPHSKQKDLMGDFIGVKNKILFLGYDDNYYLFDIDTFSEEFLISCESFSINKQHCVKENNIYFYNSDKIKRINIDTKNVENVISGKNIERNFLLNDNNLYFCELEFFPENVKVMKYNLNSQEYTELYNIEEFLQPFWYGIYSGELFVYLSGKVPKFISIAPDGKVTEHFTEPYHKYIGSPLINKFSNNQEMVIFDPHYVVDIVGFNCKTKKFLELGKLRGRIGSYGRYIGNYYYYISDSFTFFHLYRLDVRKEFKTENFESVYDGGSFLGIKN